MSSLKAQNLLKGWELNFYTAHTCYRLKLSNDDIVPSRNKNLKDSVIIGYENLDSIKFHLPLPEKIDSVQLIVGRYNDTELKVISYEGIFSRRDEIDKTIWTDPMIFESIKGWFPNSIVVPALNNMGVGDMITLRKVRCTRIKDGNVMSVSSVIIHIN